MNSGYSSAPMQQFDAMGFQQHGSQDVRMTPGRRHPDHVLPPYPGPMDDGRVVGRHSMPSHGAMPPFTNPNLPQNQYNPFFQHQLFGGNMGMMNRPTTVSETLPLSGELAAIAGEPIFQRTLFEVRTKSAASYITVNRNSEGRAESITIEAPNAQAAQFARSLVELHLKSQLKLKTAQSRFAEIQSNLYSTQGEIAAGHIDEFKVDPEVIGVIIGKKGARINKIKADFDLMSINISDTGVITICGSDTQKIREAREQLEVVEEECPITAKQAEWLSDKYNKFALNDFRDEAKLLGVRLNADNNTIVLLGPKSLVSLSKYLWEARLEYLDQEIEISLHEREARDKLKDMRKQYGYQPYRDDQNRNRAVRSQERENNNNSSSLGARNRSVEVVKSTVVSDPVDAIINKKNDASARRELPAKEHKEVAKKKTESRVVVDTHAKTTSESRIIEPVAVSTAISIGAPPGIFKKKEKKPSMLQKLRDESIASATVPKTTVVEKTTVAKTTVDKPTVAKTTPALNTAAMAANKAISEREFTLTVSGPPSEAPKNVSVTNASTEKKADKKKRRNNDNAAVTSAQSADKKEAAENAPKNGANKPNNKEKDAVNANKEVASGNNNEPVAVADKPKKVVKKQQQLAGNESNDSQEKTSSADSPTTDALPKRDNKRRSKKPQSEAAISVTVAVAPAAEAPAVNASA